MSLDSQKRREAQGEVFRKAREAAKKTQADVGFEVGVAAYVVSNWETGRTAVPFDLVPLLAEVVSLPASEWRKLKRTAVA